MKQLIFIQLWIVLMAFLPLRAQDVITRLQEAEKSYTSGQLEETRFALQEAIASINQEIGKEILKALPANLGGLPADMKQDNIQVPLGLQDSQ
jgi:hypothetical protein